MHNAGKSTTISMLTGQLGATSGDAVVWGHSVRDDLHKVNTRNTYFVGVPVALCAAVFPRWLGIVCAAAGVRACRSRYYVHVGVGTLRPGRKNGVAHSNERCCSL